MRLGTDIRKIIESENPITGPSDRVAPIRVKTQKMALKMFSALRLSPNR